MDLDGHIADQAAIEALALRWVKAWGGAESSWRYNGAVRDVKMVRDGTDHRITFSAYITDGIYIGIKCSIRASYLNDEATLVQDSIAAKKAYDDRRMTFTKRQRELEQIPEVIEWRSMESQRSSCWGPTDPGGIVTA